MIFGKTLQAALFCLHLHLLSVLQFFPGPVIKTGKETDPPGCCSRYTHRSIMWGEGAGLANPFTNRAYEHRMQDLGHCGRKDEKFSIFHETNSASERLMG